MPSSVAAVELQVPHPDPCLGEPILTGSTDRVQHSTAASNICEVFFGAILAMSKLSDGDDGLYRRVTTGKLTGPGFQGVGFLASYSMKLPVRLEIDAE